MEVLGAVASGLTLADLFNYSSEALDLIHLYQSQDADFNSLQLQFKLEKCRLYNWGVEMGLADPSKRNLLHEWHSRNLIAQSLQQIIHLFSSAQEIRKKYGCDNIAGSSASLVGSSPQDFNNIGTAFNHFRIQPTTPETERPSILRKSKWVIRDRKKFLVLISEVRGLIDSLENITNDLSSRARLEESLRNRINEIANVDTLLMIASVWKGSHPRLASAASNKAESISMSSGKQNYISEWQISVGDEASEETVIAKIEDLTVTELKHSIVRSSQEIEALKRQLENVSQTRAALIRRMSSLDNSQRSHFLRWCIFLVALNLPGYLWVIFPLPPF
ncbi:hypothetical protein FOPG_17233 [Fusarium oxysporum f. sp. conglutinans race 2 54008]|uniref:Prion-inhibition and propagation HeLo domain-containing protein n=2 Tax=Fusarium oxysporum f. sp. conglutinans TaxID=100902 RepID=F9F906_FUSOF|nr:hypothetical protein FOXB_02881 [Fusarium oxysporum f. sp. conglutinans Fo5176]EXL66616.1 hypothetical protein FOPG_17233 [Fusarium oxysporum f. sp. conglutinans race 2 54008]KAG7001216.1 Heterokaryon incompatibility protein S [Fusarium oxysporum f. sp. conglutinans]KAI8417230.1 hypothetical protein FOFC_03543 [Fusarium oxysporum]